MYVILDPILLSVPENSTDRGIWLEFVEQLLSWSDAIKLNKQRVKISSLCSFALTTYIESISNPRMIDELLVNATVIEYSGDLVHKTLIHILCNLPHFEDDMGIQCDWDSENDWIEIDGKYIWSHDIIELDPKLYAFHIHPKIGVALRLTVGLITYLINERKSEINFFVATRPFGVSLPTLLSVLIRQEDAKNDADEQIEAAKASMSHDFDLIGDAQHLAELLDLESFWEDTALAIQWGLRQVYKSEFRIQYIKENSHFLIYKKDTEHNKRELLASISVGPAFNQSIKDRHFDSKKGFLSILFRKLATTISKQLLDPNGSCSPPASTYGNHFLLKAGSVVDRDNWKAWRHWIVQYEGDRIHYWWNPEGNHFYLANVVSHNEFDIEPIHLTP